MPCVQHRARGSSKKVRHSSGPTVCSTGQRVTSTDSGGSPHPGSTFCGQDAQRPRRVQPAASEPSVTARAWPTAPGVSPCRHSESTDPGERQGVAPRSPASSSSTAPGSDRSTSRPSLVVGAVGEALAPHRPARVARPASPGRPAMVSTGQPARPVEHGARLRLVVEHPVVERPVRLDVATSTPARAAISLSVADLVGHLLAQHVGVDVEGHPAEVLPVVVGDLRPDRDAELGRAVAHRRHDRGVAGVVAAGDVGAGDDLEQRRVVGDLLAEVGVQVDVPACPHARPG